MSNATSQLAEKMYYHELTEKQKSVIDAFAENPEASDTELHKIANEKLSEEGESITRAYIPIILDKYETIAHDQMHKNQNGREEGVKRFENVPDEPEIVENEENIEENEEKEEPVVVITYTREEIESMMNFTSSEEIQERFEEKLMDSILGA